jgi:hypothetical protein
MRLRLDVGREISARKLPQLPDLQKLIPPRADEKPRRNARLIRPRKAILRINAALTR